MSNLHGRMPTRGPAFEEHDKTSKRRRVATWSDGNSVAYEDETFDSGDDQVILDIYSDIDHNGHNGYFINDGPGDIKLEISNNGTDYGGLHLIRGGERMALDDLNISRIRLTYVDQSAYRCLVT